MSNRYVSDSIEVDFDVERTDFGVTIGKLHDLYEKIKDKYPESFDIHLAIYGSSWNDDNPHLKVEFRRQETTEEQNYRQDIEEAEQKQITLQRLKHEREQQSRKVKKEYYLLQQKERLEARLKNLKTT
jgi:hypothetical protein